MILWLACAILEPSEPTSAEDSLFPHAAGFLVDHGVARERQDECVGCHGVADSTAPACDSCHTAFPHGTTWAEPTEHGAWFVERGAVASACDSCHVETDCAECHESYPHADDWSQRQHHGVAAEASCSTCHGATWDGGATGVACASCHAAYPHAEGFSTGHVDAVGIGEATCLRCHSPGDGPETMPASCGAVCHGGAP
ncbi:MAG: hypothetical protein GY913_35920 [Proteobacteria bacterium]|nr:hypothetical protein [Pseudomonadota bacterium]MCP4922319.1 hypothetical protein [Pseudomonadota bacterium]